MKIWILTFVLGEKLPDPEFTDEIEPFANSRLLSFNRFACAKNFSLQFLKGKKYLDSLSLSPSVMATGQNGIIVIVQLVQAITSYWPFCGMKIQLIQSYVKRR